MNNFTNYRWLSCALLCISLSGYASATEVEINNPVVPGGRITQLHGEYPSVFDDATHIGVDIAPPLGEADCAEVAVHSFADGVVEEAVVIYPADQYPGKNTGYALMLKHTGDHSHREYYTTYLHLSAPPIKTRKGQAVEKREVIGYMGRTGTTVGGCHTHFEIKNRPMWGGLWSRSAGDRCTPEDTCNRDLDCDAEDICRENIYGLGDVRKTTAFRRKWEDPIPLFCQHPEGVSAGQRLVGGCPDLRVYRARIKLSPKVATFGDIVSANFAIKNHGDSLSYSSTANIRLAPRDKGAPTTDDPLLASIDLEELAPRGVQVVHENLEIPQGTHVGEYKLWVVLDVESKAGQHPNDEKNDRVAVDLEVERRTPDLSISRLRVNPHRFEHGEAITIRFWVKNKGKRVSKNSMTRVRIGVNESNVTRNDPELFTIPVPPIAPGGELKIEETLNAPGHLAVGEQYVWAIADVESQAGQLDEDELNDKSKFRVTVLNRIPIGQ